MIPFNEVVSRIPNAKYLSKTRVQAPCPCHNDVNPSFFASEGNDGRTLLYCQAGCRTADILKALDLTFADITPDKSPPKKKKPRFDFKNIVSTYDYGNGTRKLRDINKNFFWQHLDNGKWVSGRGDAPHVLYAQGNPSDVACIHEGEKDVNNTAKKLNRYAVSSENGAGTSGKKWFVEYNEELRGKTVYLIPDNDKIGREYMLAVARSIYGIAKSIKILYLTEVYPDLPEKGDISDLIDLCGADETNALLERLIAETPDWIPTEPDNSSVTNDVMAKLATKTVERKDGGTDTQVLCTSDNFRLIFENDPHFANVRFDVLKGYPVKVYDDRRVAWIDADDAESRTYIETVYGISNRQKCEDGFLVFLQSRRFHPVQERLDKLEWDGQPRCEQFFIKWMGAADEPYTRETSRLFFAGGVHRAYKAGCKFDCVLTLQDKQGSGKSTMTRWLAIEDDFYASTKTISGMRGLESILAKWVIELEELTATLANDHGGTKQEEAAKAFLSTQSDYYRQPYARRPEEHPRSCVFVGTTNRMEFLSDKSGNRRWYPLRLDSDSKMIYDHEKEIKADILQCWAEMVHAYKAGEPFASPTAKTDMLSKIKDQQADAELDDYRAGLVEEYVTDKHEICLYEIWKNVFYRDALNVPPMRRADSVELAEILVNTLHWKRGGTKIFPDIGRQKAFINPTVTDESDESVENLPF